MHKNGQRTNHTDRGQKEKREEELETSGGYNGEGYENEEEEETSGGYYRVMWNVGAL